MVYPELPTSLAQDMVHDLLAERIYVIDFSYPVVPKGKARIRVQISAPHTSQELDNAIEAIDGQGEVVIDLSYDSILQIVRIEVADSGKGIPAEHEGRLFEPYFSTKKSGTGLGLAIVNTIVTDHNGFIRVQDNKPKGTRFVIELPVRFQQSL